MLNHRLAPSAMEPRGVVAHYEPGKGTMTIWSSTQNPHILRTMIAAMNGMGQDQVRAIAPEVGGGFGAKINIYAEEYVAAAVAKKLGIAVKWIEDRSEAFVATIHGRDILCYLDLAAKRDGKVLGMKMRLIADIGAYNMLLTAAIPTLTMLMANATYDIPAIRATLTEVFTNKTPTDAYRGAGRPEATYFVERGYGHAGARAEDGSRLRCGARTSSRKPSSPSRRRWARSTTRATTKRRSISR
jgi:carbon-monoxide dehydrogenase large subunit